VKHEQLGTAGPALIRGAEQNGHFYSRFAPLHAFVDMNFNERLVFAYFGHSGWF
jgi:hypothetical protein